MIYSNYIKYFKSKPGAIAHGMRSPLAVGMDNHEWDDGMVMNGMMACGRSRHFHRSQSIIHV